MKDFKTLSNDELRHLDKLADWATSERMREAMTYEEALKAFECPRPNGWFRDDEVAAAREALRTVLASKQQAKPKRASLDVLELMCREAKLVEVADILKALREKVVPWLEVMVPSRTFGPDASACLEAIYEDVT